MEGYELAESMKYGKKALAEWRQMELARLAQGQPIVSEKAFLEEEPEAKKAEPDEKPILKWMDEEDEQDEDDDDDGGCTWSHFDQVLQNLTTALNDISYKLDFIDHTLRRMANAWDGKGDLR